MHDLGTEAVFSLALIYFLVCSSSGSSFLVSVSILKSYAFATDHSSTPMTALISNMIKRHLLSSFSLFLSAVAVRQLCKAWTWPHPFSREHSISSLPRTLPLHQHAILSFWIHGLSGLLASDYSSFWAILICDCSYMSTPLLSTTCEDG